MQTLVRFTHESIWKYWLGLYLGPYTNIGWVYTWALAETYISFMLESIYKFWVGLYKKLTETCIRFTLESKCKYWLGLYLSPHKNMHQIFILSWYANVVWVYTWALTQLCISFMLESISKYWLWLCLSLCQNNDCLYICVCKHPFLSRSLLWRETVLLLRWSCKYHMKLKYVTGKLTKKYLH